MRIFILDDDIRRHQAFAQNLAGHDVTHAHSYDMGVKALLQEERFHLFFLDRDLNDFGLRSIGPTTSMYGGIRELTGEDFCRFIAGELPKEKYPDLFVIHSHNENGAARMEELLRALKVRIHVERFHNRLGRQIGRGPTPV